MQGAPSLALMAHLCDGVRPTWHDGASSPSGCFLRPPWWSVFGCGRDRACLPSGGGHIPRALLLSLRLLVSATVFVPLVGSVRALCRLDLHVLGPAPGAYPPSL